MKPPEIVTLTPGKRVLFLTKDPELIRKQLSGELDLQMKDLRVEDLLDDINTDAMTPAWVCFDYKPEDIARNAYAGWGITLYLLGLALAVQVARLHDYVAGR